ncbi:ankyrin repeat and fibronectin type-III domain-containing protein 1-like isoform X3 [Strigops habroptila]|nr:ankyrin repeat and fibronectin type-III domain-containing protein 1-like isoform X3 [Strigops habroptila]XP_030340388.1 ankyrin repeat and fibronectin type-III domain-containing protein 1-like isoform X3 [Strigops habroptila]XP_030340389.1 ankyrin repeat and fibronectin type-III domain-containing protein 1-like isoform X3 [Strigops habroptila]XP_030340390.1 ankyrin repeat and fibronectin type-III domain-containing protein 1-like isoform X3 [Strigops habroptila]
MPEQKPYKKHSAPDPQKGCTVPSTGEAWRLEDDCTDPPSDTQLGTAVEDAPFSYFRTRSFYMRKSLSVDNHLGSFSYAVHPAETKAERVKTKLRRQFSLGSADKKDFYQPKSESSLSKFAHRLSVKQKQEKRRKAEYASAELSAFRPRSLSIEWSSSPKMTQQMRDLQLAQARKPPGPSSPNAAKRLYRNLSGKFRVNYTSFDEGSLAGRGEKEKLRKSYLFQSNAALFEAVELQDLDRVQELLKQYSPEELDLNTPNSEGLLPLDIAIMTNNAPIARALLQAGAKESPHFVSLESRSLHLSTLMREAEQRVNELTAQVVNEAPNTDCSDKEKQLKAWEWRYQLYKRMKAGFEHARVPDAPTNVCLSVASSSSVQVTFGEPLSVNSAIVTKYKVEWSCFPTFSPLLGEAVIDKLKNLHFTIQGLVSGTAYYVQVSAYNMKGWGPPQASMPLFAVPSNWREYDGRAPRRRGQAEALDHLLGQVKTVHQHCICHEPCKNQPQSRKHSVSKSLKHLFHPGSKFLKTLKRGLYLTAIFYKDDNILVTHEDQIPVVEIDDTYSCLLMQDFLWFTKVSCMWDEILWLRQCVTVSQSSCSCILQTRFKMLLAISQMQGLLGIQDLGQVFFEPVKDKQGNILIVTLKEVKTNQTFESVRWVPICKLQSSRKSVSSPEEPTALDTLLISIQDKLAYHQRSSHALSPGLYLGYLKLCSAVDQIRVLVPEQLPNILCHVKIRSNPNISREEWEWLQKMVSVEEPVPVEPEAETSQNHLFQELQVAIKELTTLVNIPLQEARDFRLYSQEVLDFGGQVSFLLLLPPSDDVCTAPGQNNPYTPRSGFLTLPLQIFELVHFFTYDREFISQYCQVSALLELESLLSQQSLREAFSDAELSTAKQRHQQVQDYIQQMEEIWREMRWIMDALQHARYKQPSCGVSLSGFLSEAGGAMKEKTRSTSSHLEYLPSPAPSPETSRKLNSDSHGLSDEEGSSEVFLATDSDYDSSRAQSPKELDLVYCSSGPECCGKRAARTLRDSAPDVLQTHELKTPPPLPPPPEEPQPPAELYDSDFVLPSRQIELLRITEKRQAYCVRTSSLDFPKPLCQVARKSCPGSVDSSLTESRTTGHCGQRRLGTAVTSSPEYGCSTQGSQPIFRTRSAEWTQNFQEQPEQPGCLGDQGKKLGSVTLRVCPQYETGLSKETSVKLQYHQPDKPLGAWLDAG